MHEHTHTQTDIYYIYSRKKVGKYGEVRRDKKKYKTRKGKRIEYLARYRI